MPKKRRDQPIVLSRIYTRTGDDGTTALGDMSRVPKTDPRLVAYADVDEANCAIGTALALAEFGDDVTAVLTRVQNELFDVGADLCNPVSANPPARRRSLGARRRPPALRITGGCGRPRQPTRRS